MDAPITVLPAPRSFVPLLEASLALPDPQHAAPTPIGLAATAHIAGHSITPSDILALHRDSRGLHTRSLRQSTYRQAMPPASVLAAYMVLREDVLMVEKGSPFSFHQIRLLFQKPLRLWVVQGALVLLDSFSPASGPRAFGPARAVVWATSTATSAHQAAAERARLAPVLALCTQALAQGPEPLPGTPAAF